MARRRGFMECVRFIAALGWRGAPLGNRNRDPVGCDRIKQCGLRGSAANRSPEGTGSRQHLHRRLGGDKSHALHTQALRSDSTLNAAGTPAGSRKRSLPRAAGALSYRA